MARLQPVPCALAAAEFSTDLLDDDAADVRTCMRLAAACLRDTSYKESFERANRTVCIAATSRF
ncbi:hypothetical protein XbrCFBP1976_09340 [Xanthomonas bromi]|uniref:Uncharacterized protein n=1 Tax=Xanthomonas bromi TaxID=56449 RepID=A0ABX5BSI9_9XANT|nr:hypothetical protein XbrCFBP1976_09340 [Xanthomonas bromi]